MIIERIIELLEIEKECVLRNATGGCNRYCAKCDLLQDDTELHEMYTEVIALLKAQEPVEPIRRSAHAQGADEVWYECGKCGEFLGVNRHSKQFCAKCGMEVKWE